MTDGADPSETCAPPAICGPGEDSGERCTTVAGGAGRRGCAGAATLGIDRDSGTGAATRGAVKGARGFPGCGWVNARSRVVVGSDEISGRAAGRISPRASGVDGIAGAERAPALSVTADEITFRSVIDSEGTAFVSRLSEIGVATGEAGDGAGDR